LSREKYKRREKREEEKELKAHISRLEPQPSPEFIEGRRFPA
jgi:hypothetical protein